MRSDHYHYIVVGAGAAGLSLLIHMIHSGRFSDKKILLIDKAPKTNNDRTWCFWEEKSGLFESVVYKEWNALWFYGNDGSSRLHNTFPYSYKMIRGIDFYDYCFEIINRQANITVEYGDAQKVGSSTKNAALLINNRIVKADYIFSSANPVTPTPQTNHYFLWQHFKGWFIKATRAVFNPDEATLMDFRVDQRNDTRFVYVMPFSDNEALVEYTVLSESKLDDHEYNEALSSYCTTILGLQKNEYTITFEEFGMIPMTNIVFPPTQGRIYYIGGAGGQTKPSSGYTFRNIQKHSAAIVQSLSTSGVPVVARPSRKFTFYDSLLLKILSEEGNVGAGIFTKLFNTNPMPKVMKFLDNETSIVEDIKVISRLPKGKFMRAAVSHLMK